MLRVEVRSYNRPFRTPMQTHHGLWENREGLILRFVDEHGQVRFGEVAPIPWFGTETGQQAKDFWAAWIGKPCLAETLAIPNTLPACQFGFSCRNPPCLTRKTSTHESSGRKPDHWLPGDFCALLPGGRQALAAWQPLWQKGYRTFKWKIGVASIVAELAVFRTLVKVLPDGAKLRLDANGGLVVAAAEQWLLACDETLGKVEFLEQPLPPDSILAWLDDRPLASKTAIALDESVATLSQLRQVHQRLGNRVVYVVKPAIAGSLQQLYRFCLEHQLDTVFSSALETPIARDIILNLAEKLWAEGLPKRALGFGVGHWFADDWDTLTAESLWQQL